MARLPHQVADRLADLPADRPAVVGVSGGADSVALLRAVAGLGRPAVAAHFHHRLRGPDADADQEFVRSLADRLGVPFRAGSADVRAAGGNTEAAARRLRYAWLADVGRGVGAAAVLTAHTADDQAETVLHRLVRGAGLQGLRGIAADRPLAPGVRLVRPMLGVTRADVLGYLGDLGQPFRVDATNADPALTRSRVRHQLLPLLKTFNPQVVGVLGRLSRQADEAQAFVAAEVARVWPEVVIGEQDGAYRLAADRIAGLPPYLARELLRAVWQSAGWPMDRMSAGHWDRLAAVAAGGGPPADFPGRVRARRVRAVVHLGRVP